MHATTVTISELIEAFNERLVALEAVDTGLRSSDGFCLIDFAVRTEWRQTDIGQAAREDVDWALSERACPIVEWYYDTNDAINWDYQDQTELGQYVALRFSVDLARTAAVMRLVEAVPAVSQAEREASLARQIESEALWPV